LDSNPPRLAGFAWRLLNLRIFAILLVATSCSRYPKAEAAQAHVVGERALNVSAETHVPNLDLSPLSKWNQLVQETIEQSARERRVVLIINKHRHTLSAYKNGYRVAEYYVDLDLNAVPTRLCEDGAMTEGKYQIVNRLGPGETKYQRAFVINCPPTRTIAGHPARCSDIPASARKSAETSQFMGLSAKVKTGLVLASLDNEALDDLFPYVGIGTPVTIVAAETVQSERKHRPGQ
jgi:hypothetical protein